MSSTTLNTGTLNCWSQSGSTKKYESSLGPFISITGCGGLATSATGIIVKNWTSDSNCNYYGHIPINYSIPDGYSETSSSSGATAATISATYTLYYGNAAPSGTVSKTIYYKKNGPTEYKIKFVWAVTGNDGIFYIDYGITFPSINVWYYISSFTSAVDTTYYTDNGYNETKRFSVTITSSSDGSKAWNEYENSMQYINDSTIVGASGTSKYSTLYSNSSMKITLQETCY